MVGQTRLAHPIAKPRRRQHGGEEDNGHTQPRRDTRPHEPLPGRNVKHDAYKEPQAAQEDPHYAAEAAERNQRARPRTRHAGVHVSGGNGIVAVVWICRHGHGEGEADEQDGD